MDYPLFMKEAIPLIKITIRVEFKNIIFLLIVSIVTTFVMLYSESYMDSYDNKKFFFLIFMFIVSILILSLSSSFLITGLWWDALGASSIFLIMFYPNNQTAQNRYLTIYFNRIRDLALLTCLGMLISQSTDLFQVQNLNIFLLFSLLICAFVKRAQFPFSSWLPAAMSAPTPVSALVHSSTLVTAGVLLRFKITQIRKIVGIIEILIWIRVAGIIMGGAIALLETDLKKIVAFSTIRQMRVILFLGMERVLLLALVHMIFHAIFKSLIFIRVGENFVKKFNTQKSKDLTGEKYRNSEYAIIAVFMMTGLVFSTSFWTKDLCLERILERNFRLKFMLFFTGRLITALYCRGLMKLFNPTPSNFKIKKRIKKEKDKKFYTLVILASRVRAVLARSGEMAALVDKKELLLINLILFSVFLIQVRDKLNISIASLSSDIFFMKSSITQMLGKLIRGKWAYFRMDNWIFTPEIMTKQKEEKRGKNKEIKRITFMLFILMILL